MPISPSARVGSVQANELEELLNGFVEELLGSIDSVPEAVVPFASVKLTVDERMARYVEMRDNPEEWTTLLKEKGWPETIAYARTMERRFREGE